MHRLLSKFLWFTLACLAVVSCAITGRPKGGELDVTGPTLDTLLSSPNFVTDVRPQELVLEFDEFVVLKNASQNILLTPVPETGRPKYVQRGKRVVVDFSEVALRDSTTYQLQFGEAVQDLNEGNAADRLRYVFSTGSFLDSLIVSGKVIDSQTDDAVPNALVGLYRYDTDTLGVAEWSDVIVRNSPAYFTRTDSMGRFTLDYLAPASYYLAAYTDANSNVRFNAGSEKLAFLDTTIRVAAGFDDTSYVLRVSPERPPLIATRADQAYPGMLRIVLNQEAPPELELLAPPIGQQVASFTIADTFFLAYRPELDSLPELVISYDGEVDTVQVRRPVMASKPPVRWNGEVDPVPGRAEVGIGFNMPLQGVVPDSIFAFSGDEPVDRGVWTIDSSDLRKLIFTPSNDSITRYAFQMLPGALRTIYDSLNRDTILVQVSPTLKAGSGEVTLTLTGLENKAYVLELLRADAEVERTIRLQSPSVDSPTLREASVVLKRVAPGNYRLRLIDDDNADGRYTPGSRRLRRQPEQVRTFGIQQVRADWTVEERILTAGELLDDSPVLDELLD